MGHWLVENFFFPAAVNTLPVMTTDGPNFVDISSFLTGNIWKFKTIDFLTFTNCKLNIELNEQIYMNISINIRKFP